jgi:hypothetical protein
VRTVGRVVALAFAAFVVVIAGLLGYALTSEYGAAPNGGGVAEAVGTVAGFALPTVLVVLVLTYVGTGTLPPRRRRLVVIGAAVVALLVAVLAVVLGSLALDQRCVRLGPQHSAACPGFTGPG